MEGIIKKLNEKGFGFITPTGESKDIFFHSNDLVDADFNQLQEGQAVSFDKESSEKGPKAVNVQLIEAVSEAA